MENDGFEKISVEGENPLDGEVVAGQMRRRATLVKMRAMDPRSGVSTRRLVMRQVSEQSEAGAENRLARESKKRGGTN